MAGLSSFLALLVAASIWLVLRDGPYVAPPPTPPDSQIQPAAGAALLQDLALAVRTGDLDAAAALASSDDADAQEQLRDLVANAEEIGLREVSLRYLDERGGLDSEGEWPATATLSLRFAGFDTGLATSEVQVAFSVAPSAVDDDSVSIAALGGPASVPRAATPVWFTDRVAVRRTPQTLVVAVDRAGRYSEMARSAVRVVQRVLRDWPGGLVVEVPASAAGVDAALGVEPGTFGNVAGVTATVDGTGSSRAPVHVFLNPERIGELRPAGAQVVVSHEAAHVALDATSSSLPVWLAEGFADYVALRDVTLPLTTTAGQIIRQVRREGTPRALPSDADFDDASEYFGAAYEASWLACRLLAERFGEGRLLRFYRQADGADEFAPLFRRTFGLTEQQFTQQWRTALSDLAG